jgi:hypothetical protein
MSRMPQQNFEALAQALREVRPVDSPQREAGAWNQWNKTVQAIANVCHDSSNFTLNGNRVFDRDRFVAATGGAV